MNGVIILNKSEDFTSFDAIAVARGITRERKIGHTGTLDPMATGVLVLLLGRAVKAADLIADSSKEYRAGFRLGEKRDTGDITGEITEKSDVLPSREAMEGAASSFIGEIEQIPPMYSAVQVKGQRLYSLARQGIEIEREPRKVCIESIAFEDYSATSGEGTLIISCSKGTYIRTLIEDIAQKAGSVGTMKSLVRTKACGFSAEEALTLAELQALADEGRIVEAIRPVDMLFEDLKAITLSNAQATRFLNGGKLDLNRIKRAKMPLADKQRIRIYSPEREFLGLATVELERQEIKPLKLFKLHENQGG